MRNLGKVRSLGHHHDVQRIGGLRPVCVFVAFVVGMTVVRCWSVVQFVRGSCLYVTLLSIYKLCLQLPPPACIAYKLRMVKQ